MKRSVGGLMVLGGWVIVPSVTIWLLGGPLWGWAAVIGGLVGAFLVLFGVVTLLEFIAYKWGPSAAILCIFVPLCAIVLTIALGYPWWFVLSGVGFVAAIFVGLLGLKWLVDG